LGLFVGFGIGHATAAKIKYPVLPYARRDARVIQLLIDASLIRFASLRKIFRLMTSVSRRTFMAANLSELTNARNDKGNQRKLTYFKFINCLGVRAV